MRRLLIIASLSFAFCCLFAGAQTFLARRILLEPGSAVPVATTGGPCWTTNSTDDFNRANSANLPASSNAWFTVTSEQVFACSNNQAIVVFEGSDSCNVFTNTHFSSNQFCIATVKAITGGTVGGGQGMGLCLRGSTSSRTFYRLIANGAASGNCEIGRKTNGGYWKLTNFTTSAWASNDVMAVCVVGQTISMYRNGTRIMQLDDASGGIYTNGWCGVSFSSSMTSSALDDWAFGDATCAP